MVQLICIRTDTVFGYSMKLFNIFGLDLLFSDTKGGHVNLGFNIGPLAATLGFTVWDRVQQ